MDAAMSTDDFLARFGSPGQRQPDPVAAAQQDQATAGIAENIGSTAQDAEIASDTIHRVIGVANEAGSAAGCVSDAAEKLAEQAAQLDSQVRTFLQRIRQAA